MVAFLGALLSLAAAVAILVRTLSTGIQVLHVGSWPAPFGITLVADLFSALMVVMAGIIGVAVTGSSFAGVDPRREGLGYHPLIHVLLMGVSGAFLTGDIFNLYVWFEVMLIALVRADVPAPDARAAPCRLHVRRTEPARLGVPADRHRAPVRPGRHAELRGPGARLAGATNAGTRRGPVHAVPDRVRHQGRLVPVVLLAARLVPHASGSRRCPARRPAHEGRRLRDDPGVHAALPGSVGECLHGVPGDVGRHDGGGPDRRPRPARFAAGAVVQSGRTHRLHDRRSRAVDTGRARRLDPVRAASHAGDLDAVPGERPVPAAETHDRPASSRGHVPTRSPFVACLALVPLFSLAGMPPLSGFIAKLAVVGADDRIAPLLCSRRSRWASACSPCCRWLVSGRSRSGSRRRPGISRPAVPTAASWRSDSRPCGVPGDADDWPDAGRGSRVSRGDASGASSCSTRTATCAPCSGKGCRVLLANLLLALAWAALQGEFSLATLATGHVLGYLILLALVRGGVLPQSPYIGRVHRIFGLATYFLWRARAGQPAPRARRGHAELSHETGHHCRAPRRHDRRPDPACCRC